MVMFVLRVLVGGHLESECDAPQRMLCASSGQLHVKDPVACKHQQHHPVKSLNVALQFR